ncbi:TetR/AcrR family transcriptional regulator, partial [Mycobacterium tuberculosis]|uniref:TetR/AcrR family transcriptional regulator n=1 Tax=Mycobacterium tuberculosis TaxID=1773 RepID=UPI0032B31FBD
MPTVTWARVDPARRAAVVEAAEAEFGAHGFSRGSLNVIARRAGVAKGSLFQYFADKRDLYAFIADIASQRVRSYMEDLIREWTRTRPFFEFPHRPAHGWVAYFADEARTKNAKRFYDKRKNCVVNESVGASTRPPDVKSNEAR